MNRKPTFWWGLLLVSLTLLTCWPALAAGAATRSISISPLAFCRITASPDFATDQDIGGLKWAANSVQQAGFYLARPPDWDGKTPVKVTIYFSQGGNNACAINWRLKLHSYKPNSGESLAVETARNADAILNIVSGPSWWRVFTQTFTLQAAAFNNKPFWSLFFLRGNGANGETFTGYLYVLNAEVRYNASPSAAVIPLGN